MSSDGNNFETRKRIIWRSLEQKANPEAVKESCGSDVVNQTVEPSDLFTLRRRKFLTLGGAMTALAGVEGCIRRPVENILPFTDMPEYINEGVPLHYATVMNNAGEALGLVITTYEGRPTKVEGNPDHPTSLGATDIFAQSFILDLYDPERSHAPHEKGVVTDFAAFDKAFEAKAAELKTKNGAGLYVLAQPTNSPSFVRMRAEVLAKLPMAKFVTYTPVSQNLVREAGKLAFGQVVQPLYSFDKADVVLALDSDFLTGEPGNTLASSQFAKLRNLDSAAGTMNRLYAVEPTLSGTGSNADHRLRLPAQDIGRYLRALAAELATTHNIEIGGLASVSRAASTDGIPEMWLKSVAKDLVAHRGRSLIIAGSRQPAAVQALAFALNRALGNTGGSVTYAEVVDPTEGEQLGAIAALVADMNSGKVETLLVLGGNPVLDAPAELKFGEALAKVPTSIAFTHYMDETASLTGWQIPRAHELESWGDQQSSLGNYSVQQPTLAPLWGGRSDIEVLGQLAGVTNWRGYEIVQATVKGRGIDGELAWRDLLHRGVAGQSYGQILGALSVRDAEVASALAKLGDAKPLAADNLEAVFVADAKLYDGRYANNTWLLEMPDPMTRITWDNAALIGPSTAKALGVSNGDMVRLTKGGSSIDIVAWVQPGIANFSVILSLGWGRKKAGSNGNGKGVDVYPLRTSDAFNFGAGVTLAKLGKKYKISQTQDHDQMEHRPIAIDATLAEYKERPNFPEYVSPDPEAAPLWKTQDYSKGQQWGMIVDLNTCNGCSTCVIACQSENNVPVVGKEQVAKGREMHWFRIDRYYVGENEDEPEVAYQPIGCQHCEQAPCENVCPVAATSHSPEGLNDIAYNRCIGTRYCLNNCPYKVRRFNFLNFNLDIAETTAMQKNPNVTVRFRGVIEKCSYCVQRIQAAKITAKQKGLRFVKDGDFQVACQQACSSGSITFGDLNDPASAIAKKSKVDRNYALLAEIGTHPRTRFLAKVRNPNPEMKS